jgi:crotonobetainyl-CoA:carnitine CoA-transferase CaiB-like acyl-CoA transferase
MPVDPKAAPGPLAGIRVIDLSTVLAGPYATMLLADLGADVVKVEPPDGDATRGWGPPWVGDEATGSRTAAYFLAVNRNKRAIRLDLKATDGADVLRRLLADGDVLVENFRPGTLDRLGFDDAALETLNPRLVHLAISGYGTTGPAADRPGYDFVIQAVGGLMSITGDADEDGGRPTKVGVAISDIVTGLHATIGILAALIAREDAGQRVDVSLLGSTLAVLVNQAQNAFVTGRAPVRRGNAHPNIVPYETFETADGVLVVAVGSERQWPRFCEAVGLPELATDPRFATNGDRVDHRTELRPLIADRLARRPTAEWAAALEAAEVPFGPIADVSEAFDSPEAAELGMSVEVDHPALGVLRQVGIPIRFESTPGAVRTPPPLLGEHTDEVLVEAGYDTATIADLRERGVI